MTKHDLLQTDVLIVGAGLVGLTMALAVENAGLSAVILDRRVIDVVNGDPRASALAPTSLRMLARLGVTVDGQTIHDMLVTEGGPDSPWRLQFGEDGEDIGVLVENPVLRAAMLARIMPSAAITLLSETEIHSVTRDVAKVEVETTQGRIQATLLIAADGRESMLRKQAGITSQRFDQDDAALVTTVAHDNPHDGLAYQRFLPGGPMALLPLTGQRCQIVWSGPKDRIKAAQDLPETDFLALVSEATQGYLGGLKLTAGRLTYPLSLQIADAVTATRLALIGDAAHVIHPLAGQGLNLGLRDVAALADGLAMARRSGQDIGVAGLLDYPAWRNLDTRMLGATTQGLATAYKIKNPLFGHMRRAVLALTNGSRVIKSSLNAEAAGEVGDLPALMRH